MLIRIVLEKSVFNLYLFKKVWKEWIFMEPVQISNNSNMKGIIKGVVISFIATIVLCLVFAMFLTFTNIQESTITPVIIIITGISIFIGSTIGIYKIQKNGLLNGALVGTIYILTIYLISSILNGYFTLNVSSFVMIIVAVIFGILGGIIAVNRK